jgi:hypothetical protein
VSRFDNELVYIGIKIIRPASLRIEGRRREGEEEEEREERRREEVVSYINMCCVRDGYMRTASHNTRHATRNTQHMTFNVRYVPSLPSLLSPLYISLLFPISYLSPPFLLSYSPASPLLSLTHES